MQPCPTRTYCGDGGNEGDQERAGSADGRPEQRLVQCPDRTWLASPPLKIGGVENAVSPRLMTRNRYGEASPAHVIHAYRFQSRS